MIQLITLHQKEEWKAYVQKSAMHDFYHTWHYHSLDKSGEPVLFVYEENDNFIAFPLLKRIIPDSDMYDLTSVYGYAGPISNRPFDELEDVFLDNFKSCFLSYLKEVGCISVFSRLNPFLKQDVLMDKFGGVQLTGRTVAIDLTVPLEIQRKNYKKSVKYFIKKANRKGYHIKEGRSLFEIYDFAAIYRENMSRVNATDNYLFDLEYFLNLLRSRDFSSKLMLVYDGEKAISGALVTYTHGIVQAHLVATLSEYLPDSPAKYLIDEISVLAREDGMNYFHLGGGVGFKDDSLFEWKASFSDMYLNYCSWNFIADQTVYNSLVNSLCPKANSKSDFFPLYRNR